MVFKILIEKGYVLNNSHFIGDDDKFLCITEMPIDLLLLDGRIGFSMIRHEIVNHFVMINIWLAFAIRLSLLEKLALEFRLF